MARITIRQKMRGSKTPMPGFIKPQLATLKSKAPVGPLWLHEIKFDGYRIQANINSGRKQMFTRNGHDWIQRFQNLMALCYRPRPIVPQPN